jgi:tetratricopeptide (TPR) repeat protein
MNSFMKQSKYYFLIISLLVGLNLSAQTVKEVVKFANEQFEEGNYSIASKEYNRAFFFGYDQKDILSLQIAQCYSQLNEYDLASDFFDKAYRITSNDSIKDEAILGKSFCLLLQKKYVLSISELYNLTDHASDKQKLHYHFLKGIAHYGIQDDSASFYEFNEVLKLSELNDSNSFALQSEFENVHRYQKRYNPNRAYIMSGIFPGSGQFSSGAFKDGINSMLLIGGLFMVSVRVTNLYSFWDAAIALFPWIQRYYLGGMDHSKALAVSKIESKRYESYLRIMKLTSPNDF